MDSSRDQESTGARSLRLKGLPWPGSSLGDPDTYFSAVPPPTWRWGQAPLTQILASGFTSGSTSCSHAYPEVRAAQIKAYASRGQTTGRGANNSPHAADQHLPPPPPNTHGVLCKLARSTMVLRVLPLATISVTLSSFHRFHKSHNHEAYF